MLLILLGGLFPLLILPGLLMHYDSAPKLLLTEFAMAGVLLFQRDLWKGLWELRRREAGRLLVWLAVAQVAWFGVAAAFSVKPWFSLFGSSWRQFGVVTLAVLCLAGVASAALLCLEANSPAKLLRALAVAGILASLYCVAQYFDIDPFQPAALYHDHAGDSVIVRPPGTMGHADYFAWWLATAFFCGLALVAIEKSGGWRWAGVASAAMTGLATILTGTRSAWVALVTGLVALVLMAGVRITKRRSLFAVAGVAVMVALLFSPAGNRMRARLQWSIEEPTGGGRPMIWRDSLRMAAARPVTGYGPETFQTSFLQWQSEDLAHLFPDFHQESPHNTLLDALVSAGVPGLILALAWGWLGIVAARRARKSGSAAVVPLTAGLMASATAAMFSSVMLAPAMLTLLVIAMLAALERPEATVAARSVGPLTRAGGVVLAGAMLAHGGLFAVSEYRLAAFRNHPGMDPFTATQVLRLPGAGDDLYVSRALANTCPQVAGALQMECGKRVMDAAVRATRTADDAANAWYSLAYFSALRNDAATTEQALRMAISIAPNWFKPHWTLARLLGATGRSGQSAGEAKRAISLDRGRHAEVAESLRAIR